MIKMQIDDKELQKLLSGIQDKAMGKGFTAVWKNFHKYMQVRIDLMFDRLAKGGSFRGVKWPPFKSEFAYRMPTKAKKVWRKSSTRSGAKTEKTIRVYTKVPASQAKLMQRTMNLRRNASKRIFQMSKKRVTFGSNIRYAAMQNRLRPFLVFEIDKDLIMARRMIVNYLMTGKTEG